MVVLDADSIMSGECLTTLVRLMEANPTAGIVQTAPGAAGRETLYARMQQFATGVYGPLFTAGLHFWQLGESYYWGHNAIIRVAPFIASLCARAPARARATVGRDPVARLRRGGADAPSGLQGVDGLRPTRQLRGDAAEPHRRAEARPPLVPGQLINSRLFLCKGLHPAHRAVFMTGVMAYVSAPLWLLSLVVSTLLLVVQTVIGPEYFVEPRQLFPIWPEWNIGPLWARSRGPASCCSRPRSSAASW